jgi:hypothetical protein
VLSASSLRRRANTAACSNSIFMCGAKIASPASIAHWQSRNCHAGHHGANHGKLYLVVETVQHLVRFTQYRVAMHTGHRLRNHCLIGFERQRPAATLTAQTALARPAAFGLPRLIGLLPLRWWQAGIPGFSSAVGRA